MIPIEETLTPETKQLERRWPKEGGKRLKAPQKPPKVRPVANNGIVKTWATHHVTATVSDAVTESWTGFSVSFTFDYIQLTKRISWQLKVSVFSANEFCMFTHKFKGFSCKFTPLHTKKSRTKFHSHCKKLVSRRRAKFTNIKLVMWQHPKYTDNCPLVNSKAALNFWMGYNIYTFVYIRKGDGEKFGRSASILALSSKVYQNIQTLTHDTHKNVHRPLHHRHSTRTYTELAFSVTLIFFISYPVWSS